MDEPEAVDERLLTLVDELYALDPSDFTAARDAHVKALKSDDAAYASRVKALRRPATAAWAVNHFVRREAAQVEQLLALGEALREAQSALDGEELRSLTRQRRQLTAALTSRVKEAAAESDQRLSAAVLDQVEATLTAALLDEGAAVAVRSGTLITPLTSTGVDAVDLASAVALPATWGFVPRARPPVAPKRPALRLVPPPQVSAQERRQAKQALAETERTLSRAQREHRSEQRRVGDLQARTLQVESELDELRRRIAQLEAQAAEVADELAAAEESCEDAASAVAEAEEERDAAATALNELQ
ncbi:hypothetical protein [Nocardioides gilvus]|uniref:hypothetical protein n=1 Tax=Nocardioides gilvus TaxID=1735589 RepID=UPI000D746051|nr:hypothetical protein [Nocardioides gilvus]